MFKKILLSAAAFVLVAATATTGFCASAAEGTTLYGSNCAGCHGALASSSKKGATPSQIQAGISGNAGGMGSLTLTADQILSISIALGGATAPAPVPAPAPKVTLTSAVSGSTVTLNWTIANLTGVSSYKVMRNGVSVGSATALSFANTGVANGTYSYEVDAVNSAGTILVKSNVVSATVNVAPVPVPVPVPAPAPKVTLTSAVSGSTVTLKWTIANLTGVTSYKVMRNGVSVGSATALSFANTTVANGTYSYEVDAVNAAGTILVKSNVVSATVNVAPAPVPVPTPTPTPGPISGASLYNTYCAKCHSALATSTKKGATAGRIQSAILSNMGGMGSLKSLDSAQISAIVTALAPAPSPIPTPTPAPAGASLYGSKCASCHGALAKSNVKGVTSARIRQAINANMGGMARLKSMTAAQLDSIAVALKGAPVGGGSFTGACLNCHYSNGKVKSGAGEMPGSGNDD
jgi:mono/diheme cytochrome c family protein